jgi:hypothetical protein
MDYTITLSPAEQKALAHVALDPQEWINNAVHERCRIAIDEIVNAEVQRKLAAGEPITGSKDDIVLAADIKSAAAQLAENQQQHEKQITDLG